MICKNMTNQEIYEKASALASSMQELDLNLPVKVNFYLQKNLQEIISLGQDVERARNEILAKYGTLNKEGTAYNFPEDQTETVNKELHDLFELEQEVKIYPIKLDWFEGVSLSGSQTSAIAFMIEEEE